MARLDPHSYCDDAQPQTASLDWVARVDFGTRTLSATATLTFERAGSGPLDLDTRGLDITRVEALDARAREFDELMDTFSLHHFIIRNGLVLDSTPEYASYQRKYASSWGALQQLIDQLSSLMARYSVPLAYVDGQKLASLALDPLAVHDERALLECLVNKDQVGACMSVPGQRYRAGAADAETAAATELQ